ncbi:T9SS type A sorting domain-containing protein [candidate division WOR-3 bacterium]|nr:T9SS type A sorting domain-containing protein [candidate division WOR-3 bacterium]
MPGSPATGHFFPGIQPTDDSMWVKVDSVSIGSPPSSFWRGLCLDPNGTDVWMAVGDGAPIVEKRNRYTGALVDSFTGQGSGPYDLVRLGDSLCVANFSSSTFYIYDTLGNSIRSFGFPPGSLRGVDWDGTKFWASAAFSPFCVYTLNPDGTVRKTLTPTGSPTPTWMGVIALDRMYENRLWISDGTSPTENIWYCSFDTVANTYSILATFSLPTTAYAGGLAFDGPDSTGSHVWAIGRSDTWLWRLKVHDALLTHNVGAKAIVAPLDTVDTGTVVAPKAVVRNFGTSEETFLTRFTIGTSYTDTITATVATGASDTLTFMDWTADSIGTFAIRCTTELAGDENPADDLCQKSIVVAALTGLEGSEVLPAAFSLDQVLPNPTGGRTSIRYGLPGPVAVRLSVYSTAGTLVRRVATGVQTPGWYTATWDGNDARGQKVGTGVYLIRFETGMFTSTRKLVVQH